LARVTVEDCLETCPDHFALVHLASARYRQLHKGAKTLVSQGKNKLVVTSLREVATGKVHIRENIRDSVEKHKQKLVSQRLQTLASAREEAAAAAQDAAEPVATAE
jgi:DNA-directed RNA polymerase omega subunit